MTDECTICFNPMIETLKTKCNHVYCKTCINIWLELKSINEHIPCPTCNEDLSYLLVEHGITRREPIEGATEGTQAIVNHDTINFDYMQMYYLNANGEIVPHDDPGVVTCILSFDLPDLS